MRVLRRRAAAMSPREKRLTLAIILALGAVSLALCFIPTFLFVCFLLALCCIVCCYLSGQLLPARLGLDPRAGVNLPSGLRRWMWGWWGTGVSVASRGRTKSGRNKTELRDAEGNFRERLVETGIYRRESLASDSFLFSPRDFLMGSYIGKPEGPPADSVRPRAGRNPREQLREKLSRPNHAVYTPNRRLSFAGEPLGTPGRFTITPQRHYPLQQPGVSSVGVLPPVKWDGFRKKNILSPRNSPAALSPVTVKIARPDHHSSPSLNHLSCAGLPRAPVDPCSRESVLKVLKESRKREVEDEDKSFTTEQKSKRRRNDSGGSTHSAFETLLPNGAPSQLVPKPGNLKRGVPSLAEDSIMKRSRTSSISSGSGVHAPRGTPGTRRNPIQSSYSSSLGLSQRKKRSAPSSPLSSPGSSRPQTPEGVSKRPREDSGPSPGAASSVRSDQTASNKAPVTSKLTPVPKVPFTTSADSTGSGGKRKRKIQLVSSNRDDHISLPPPPELGYTITVKDLDEEKKAALSKIQKVLETPASEPEKSASPPAATLTSQLGTSYNTTTTTLSSLLAAPLPTASSSAIPVINLDPSPISSASTTTAASNPLLEALKMKISIPSSSTSAANTATVSATTTPVLSGGLTLKVSTPSATPQRPAASQSSSAFALVLGQVSKASGGALPVTGSNLFGLASPISTPAGSSPSYPPSAAVAAPAGSLASVSSANPLLASGFKPIFSVTAANATTTSAATSATESKPPAGNFTPIFGAATAGAGFGQPPPYSTTNPASTVSLSSVSSMFGSTSSTVVTSSGFPGMTSLPTSAATTGSITATQPTAQPAVKSLFGNWSAPSTTSTSSASAQSSNTGSPFQFGAATTTAAAAPAAAATTTSSNSGFSFGAAQQDPQAANQKVFPFAHSAPGQNTTTASFGGFAMASAASTTTAAASQSNFTFGKPSLQAPQATPASFGSSAAPATQATFGSSAAPATQATFGSSAAPATQATFGSSAAPATQATFGSSAAPATQATFGSSAAPATQVTFGSSAAPATQATFGSSAAPATQVTFGSSAAPATQATFGSSAAPATQVTFGSTAPATQVTFGSTAPSTFGSVTAAPKQFSFGGSGPASSTPAPNTAPPPFPFGSAAVPTTKPAFGASSAGFAFGVTTAPSAAASAPPSFGATSQTQSAPSATFAFGRAAPQQAPAGAAQPAPGGFNFGAAMPCPQFGTPVSNNPAPQMGSFNFGAAATDKPAFGTSTPSFGQSAVSAAGPIPFGSPATPVQNFNAGPFGSPAAPSFSIGAGSKPSGARQRLQARRQHNRKK
ncbi:nuclear envelope pore membrane protein POM 121 [Pungitius pungitius]|uniref:nuclear envelope pore membrane protein POM 121 n=1 Tax=Pungitius pungitius TaxID=134920 RepID=UPI002E0E6823